MFGVGILLGLGRRLVARTVAETGLLPAGYYRHLALEALEEEDFPRALEWLQHAQDPLLTQLLVLRLRLLAARHEKQRQAVLEFLEPPTADDLRRRSLALLEEERRAVGLLHHYERQALRLLKKGQSPPGPHQPA
jgi:hypothetical protein